MSFSDSLTAGQVQLVLDALQLPWRDHHNPDNKGWVNMAHIYFFSDLSVNIEHGGWVDQYHANQPKRENFPVSREWFEREDPGYPTSGDLVMLVMCLKFGSDKEVKAIHWMKDVLGIKKGTKPPELGENGRFYREWAGDGNKFVQVPDSIWQSDISSSALRVWIAIAARVNPGEVFSFAGIRNICKKSRLTSPTVQKAIAELVTARLLHQKPARKGQKFIRFPIVRDTDQINFYLNQNVSMNGQKKED